jgi:Flp pilus assembly pilin Flp
VKTFGILFAGIRLFYNSSRTSNAMGTLVKFLKQIYLNRDGAVLMEYAVLMTLIILPMIIGANMLFNPTGGTGADAENFGFLGNSFVAWYERIVSGVSLPVP